MSLDLEQRLRTFFASAPQRVHPVQVLEISHPAMPVTFVLWREPRAGQVTTELGVVLDVLCVPFEVKLAGSQSNLDQQFQVSIDTTDAQDEFREAMDSIPLDSEQKASLVYREYLSDDLSEPQAVARLQIESVAYATGGATITAVSPRLNVTRTGELYAPAEIPMLRGFL